MHGISDRERAQCRLIVEHTRLVTGAVRVVLLLYDETTQLLEPVASTQTGVALQQVANELIERNHPGLHMGHLSYRPNVNPVVTAAFVGQRTQVTPMAEALENIYPPSVIAVARGIAGVTHLATCPVVWEGRGFGIVRFQLSGVPTNAQQALMEAAASQIGLTLANAELAEQMRRQLGATQAVGEVARQAATGGVQATARALVERMREIAGADLAIVYLTDPAGETFRPVAACLADPSQVSADDDRRLRIGVARPAGDGLAGWVIASGEAAFVQDDRLDPRVRTRRPFAPAQAIIAVPMRVRGRTMGCLRLSKTNSRRFTEADLWLAQTLADGAALAIDGAARQETALAQARATGDEAVRRLRSEIIGIAADLEQLGEPHEGEDASSLRARLAEARARATRLHEALEAAEPAEQQR